MILRTIGSRQQISFDSLGKSYAHASYVFVCYLSVYMCISSFLLESLVRQMFY